MYALRNVALVATVLIGMAAATPVASETEAAKPAESGPIVQPIPAKSQKADVAKGNTDLMSARVLTNEGALYLSNCARGEIMYSEMDYYQSQADADAEEAPDASVQVGSQGGYVFWESTTGVDGNFNAASGGVLHCSIGPGGQDGPVGTQVGSCGNQDGDQFLCYKDDGSVLYVPRGGSVCREIYYCLRV